MDNQFVICQVLKNLNIYIVLKFILYQNLIKSWINSILKEVILLHFCFFLDYQWNKDQIWLYLFLSLIFLIKQKSTKINKHNIKL